MAHRTRHPDLFDQANRYARELAVTTLLVARALGALAGAVFMAYYVLATVVHGHPPFTLPWFGA